MFYENLVKINCRINESIMKKALVDLRRVFLKAEIVMKRKDEFVQLKI